MKNSVILILLILSCKLYSQDLNVYYRITSVIDTLNKENKNISEPFILSIKGEKSVYSSLDKLIRDSTLLKANTSNIAELLYIRNGLKKASTSRIVFKHDNAITFQDIVNAKTYLYPRSNPNNNWTLGDKFKIIGGYKCNNAYLQFSGRKWEAWFTNDIPISNGPYIFGGLPGLILEIYDTENLHKIDFIGIDKKVRFFQEISDEAIRLKSAKVFQKVFDNADGNMIFESESMGVRYSAEAKRLLLENLRNKKKDNNPFELIPDY